MTDHETYVEWLSEREAFVYPKVPYVIVRVLRPDGRHAVPEIHAIHGDTVNVRLTDE